MPCSCFGKHKKKPKEESSQKLLRDQTKIDQSNTKIENDAAKNTKKSDVVASYPEGECALLGYRPAGSRPPSSSYIDSPLTNSHTHTPSTLPVATSSNSSQSTSASSSPLGLRARAGASSRAELAEKRREFFIDFLPRDEFGHRYDDSSSSTLPTVARARQFGQVRPMRPISQPVSPSGSSIPEPPPPGPHLLRPSSTRSPTKIDTIHATEATGFASAEFLRELKTASDEISRRWALSEFEPDAETARNNYNNSKNISNLEDRHIQGLQTTERSSDVPVDFLISLDETSEEPALINVSQNFSYNSEMHRRTSSEEVDERRIDYRSGATGASSNESLSVNSDSDDENRLKRTDAESYAILEPQESISARVDFPDEFSKTDFTVQDTSFNEMEFSLKEGEKLTPIIEFESSSSSSSPSEHGEDEPLVVDTASGSHANEIIIEEE